MWEPEGTKAPTPALAYSFCELIFNQTKGNKDTERSVQQAGLQKHYKVKATSQEHRRSARLTQPLPARLDVRSDAVEFSLKLLSSCSHKLMVLSYYLGLGLRCLNLQQTKWISLFFKANIKNRETRHLRPGPELVAEIFIPQIN